MTEAKTPEQLEVEHCREVVARTHWSYKPNEPLSARALAWVEGRDPQSNGETLLMESWVEAVQRKRAVVRAEAQERILAALDKLMDEQVEMYGELEQERLAVVADRDTLLAKLRATQAERDIALQDCEGLTLELREARALVEGLSEGQRDLHKCLDDAEASEKALAARVETMLPYVRASAIRSHLLRRPKDAPLGEGENAWYGCCGLCESEWHLPNDEPEVHAPGCIAAP